MTIFQVQFFLKEKSYCGITENNLITYPDL